MQRDASGGRTAEAPWTLSRPGYSFHLIGQHPSQAEEDVTAGDIAARSKYWNQELLQSVLQPVQYTLQSSNGDAWSWENRGMLDLRILNAIFMGVSALPKHSQCHIPRPYGREKVSK